MTTQKQREIVIEYERIQLIRKKAKTEFTHCETCGGKSDFVALRTAAQLFGTSEGDLTAFIAANEVHASESGPGGGDICIPSLLAVMDAKRNGGGVRLIGE